MRSGAPLRLHRDEVTHAGYAILATWAWFLYGFGALLRPLGDEQGISRTTMGLHSLALAGGALVAGATALVVVRRLRRRGAVRLGLLLVAVGSTLLCLGRSPVMTVPAVLLVGIGGSTLVNSASPTLSDHHGPAAAAALAEGNAVAAGVGLLAPLAVSAGLALGLGWRPAVLVVVPLALGVALLLRRVPRDTPALDAVLPPRSGGPGRLTGTFWLFAGVLVTCVGIEFCCAAWSADLLRQRTGLSTATASLGVTAVVAGMAVGRAAAGRIALYRPARSLLFSFLAVTAVGWLVTWVSTAPAAALAGLALTGLGIAGHYPLGVSLVYGAAPDREDQATGVLSLGIGLSSGLLPFTVGALADATSTHAAFVVVPAMVALATLLLLAAGRSRPTPT